MTHSEAFKNLYFYFMCAVHLHARHLCAWYPQIPDESTSYCRTGVTEAVSYRVHVGNRTQVPYKSSMCSWPPSHLSSPTEAPKKFKDHSLWLPSLRKPAFLGKPSWQPSSEKPLFTSQKTTTGRSPESSASWVVPTQWIYLWRSSCVCGSGNVLEEGV